MAWNSVIYGSHSYNFLKGSATHHGIHQHLPLPIPVFIILYVYTPSSLGQQSLSIAFPPDNAPSPLFIPTTILILLISLLLPLTITVHYSVSAPSTFLSPSFLRTKDNTLSLVGWFYELVSSNHILSPHYTNTQSSNLASFLLLSAWGWDWKDNPKHCIIFIILRCVRNHNSYTSFVVAKALDHTYLFQHVCVYLQQMTNKVHNKGSPNMLFTLLSEQFFGLSVLFTKQNPS